MRTAVARWYHCPVLWVKAALSSRRVPGRTLFVASTGGHLLQAVKLAEPWSLDERRWVTFEKGNALGLLADEHVTWAHHPTSRSLINLFRNLLLAWRTISNERPPAVISTGSGVAVPFAVVSRLRGIPMYYVESMSRISSPSLTGRLVYPLVNRFFVQWPEMLQYFPRARYQGSAYDLRHARD
ncbi:MAG: PssD/Cps14F family polysaccharide biosynthesis glycosyltransferase [Actinomycetes bacterium]